MSPSHLRAGAGDVGMRYRHRVADRLRLVHAGNPRASGITTPRDVSAARFLIVGDVDALPLSTQIRRAIHHRESRADLRRPADGRDHARWEGHFRSQSRAAGRKEARGL